MDLRQLFPRRPARRLLIFGTIAIGTFVSVLDQTGVNLALPRIADHFDATIPSVQWVSLGYALTTGSLLLPMGRLSDMVGRKRVYVSGFALFVLGAILAGLSSALIALVLFKVLQGVGSAMIQSNGMAIVTSTFPASQRGKMIGLFMTVVGMGAITGTVVGGAVVGLLGWRYLFLMGAPLGAASLVAALVALEGRSADAEDRVEGAGGFDWLGAVLSSSTLALFLLTMTNAHRVGWGSALVIAGFVVAESLFVAFIWWERHAQNPMLALDLFKRRVFAFGTTASFLTFLPGTSVFFLMPFYLQGVLRYSAAETGLIMAPTALCFAVAGPIAGRLSDAYGTRRFTLLGLLALGGSLLALSRLGTDASLGIVVAALVGQGLGMGLFFSPNASAVMSSVDRSRYGIVTAYLNMIRNVASVTGIAMTTAIVTSVMASLGQEPTLDVVSAARAEGATTAFTTGLQWAYLTMAGIAGLASVLSFMSTGGASDRAASATEQPVSP